MTHQAFLKVIWQNLNGDASYARYLDHWAKHHHVVQNEQPLTRKQYFAAETLRKWNGIKRCC